MNTRSTTNRSLGAVMRGAIASATLAVSAGAALAQSAVEGGPTIYHTVRMELRDDADPAEVERVLSMMRDLGDKLEVVDHYVVGTDLAPDFDVSATYVLTGYDAYRTYMYDPLHLEIDKSGLPLVQNMVSFDVTDADDPELAAQEIAMIHQNRIDEVEGLAELLEQMESYRGGGE